MRSRERRHTDRHDIDVEVLADLLVELGLRLSEEERRRLAEAIERLLASGSGAPERETQSLRLISAREMEVLTLLANGYSRRDIAAVLGVTFNTAASHVLNIYRKLDINTIAEATQFAVRSGLLR